MSLPPLDVVLGSEFATQRAEPRLRERSAAAWASLLDALRTSQPAAASALAYLARTRLLTPPASEEAAELLLRELQSTSPLAVDAALLLARWAASGRGGARAAAAQAALLWQPGDGGGAAARALLLAAASASPGCPHAAWAAALDALEQRVAEIRVARRLPEALAACGLLVASAQASASAARAAAAALALAGGALQDALLLDRLFFALCSNGARGAAATEALSCACDSGSPASALAAAGALRARPAEPQAALLRACLQRCAARESPPASRAAAALAWSRLPSAEAGRLDDAAGFAFSRAAAASLCHPAGPGVLAPLAALARGNADGARAALAGPVCAEAGRLTAALVASAARLPPPLRLRLLRALASLAAAAEDGASAEGPVAAAAQQLPLLVLATFLSASRAAYAAAGDGGECSAARWAGASLAALARAEAARLRHGPPLPPGYAQLLSAAAAALRDGGPEGCDELLREPPLDAAGAVPPARAARAAFLCRALPFALPALARGGAGARPLLQRCAALALASARLGAAAGAGQLALAALLRAAPADEWRAPLAAAAGEAALACAAEAPAASLAAALEACLDALPAGSPAAERLMGALARAAEAAEGASARVALFSLLPATHASLLPAARAACERALRALPSAAERQRAMDELCAACGPGTAVDGPRKRAQVDWCLRLAASL